MLMYRNLRGGSGTTFFPGTQTGQLGRETHMSSALVDQDGRCIPTGGVKGKVVDADRSYGLFQPRIDYDRVLAWQQQHFGEMQLVSSTTEFETRTMALLAKVEGERRVSGLFCGIHLPFVLPQCVFTDYGTTLEEIFLGAVKRSYEKRFPKRKFVSCRAGELVGRVTVIEASRHNELIEAMAKGPVVGVLFPTALQGFDGEFGREMIAQFPEGFALAGAIDMAACHVAYPGTLAEDGNTPAFDCSAIDLRDGGLPMFRSFGDKLEFFDRPFGESEFCSGGVVVFDR